MIGCINSNSLGFFFFFFINPIILNICLTSQHWFWFTHCILFLELWLWPAFFLSPQFHFYSSAKQDATAGEKTHHEHLVSQTGNQLNPRHCQQETENLRGHCKRPKKCVGRIQPSYQQALMTSLMICTAVTKRKKWHFAVPEGVCYAAVRVHFNASELTPCSAPGGCLKLPGQILNYQSLGLHWVPCASRRSFPLQKAAASAWLAVPCLC